MNPLDKFLRNQLAKEEFPLQKKHLADMEALLIKRDRRRRRAAWWWFGSGLLVLGAAIALWALWPAQAPAELTLLAEQSTHESEPTADSRQEEARQIDELDPSSDSKTNESLAQQLTTPLTSTRPDETVPGASIQSDNEALLGAQTSQSSVDQNATKSTQSTGLTSGTNTVAGAQQGRNDSNQSAVVAHNAGTKLAMEIETGRAKDAKIQEGDVSHHPAVENPENQLGANSPEALISQPVSERSKTHHTDQTIPIGAVGVETESAVRIIADVSPLNTQIHFPHQIRNLNRLEAFPVPSADLNPRWSMGFSIAGLLDGFAASGLADDRRSSGLAIGAFYSRRIGYNTDLHLESGMQWSRGGFDFEKESVRQNPGFGARSEINTLEMNETYQIYLAAMWYREFHRAHAVGLGVEAEYVTGAKGDLTIANEDQFAGMTSENFNNTWVSMDGIRRVPVYLRAGYRFRLTAVGGIDFNVRYAVSPMIRYESFDNGSYVYQGEQSRLSPGIRIHFNLINQKRR